MNAMTHSRALAGRTLALAAFALILSGCATWQPPADAGDSALRARAVTHSSRGVNVSATVLGADDSVRMFGIDVVAKGVQPVWVEVKNDTPDVLWLLRSGSDPDYFSPLEVAWAAHSKFGGKANEQIDEQFDRMAFASPIRPGQTSSGMLYTNPQPVSKLLNLDLLGNRQLIPFSLLLDVPGYDSFRNNARLRKAPIGATTDYSDRAALRTALERLPHCTTVPGSAECGQPLNLILIGSLEDIAAATSRRGYRRDIREADLALQVFGRSPDYAARKQGQAESASNWVRAWRAPITYQGKSVFVAQVGRPVGGRFATDDAAETRLHGAIDEVRSRFIQNTMYSGGLEAIGFLPTVGAIPRDQPRVLPDGTSYFTDGVRAVMFFAIRPLTFADVEFLDWEPYLEQVEAAAGARQL